MHKDIELKGGTIISFWEEWSQFLHVRKFNWCTLNFINFEIEYDRHLGGLELMIILAGLGFRVRIPIKTDKSEQEHAKLREALMESMSGTDGWILESELKEFKKKYTNSLVVFRTRKKAREEAYGMTTVKKIYFHVIKGR
jgi:hypothetical protein